MFFLVLALLPLTFASPLSLAFSKPPIANLTSSNSLTTNLTSSYRCSDSRKWIAKPFLREDCFAAVQAVYINYVIGKDTVYEFREAGSAPKTTNPWMYTPFVYTVNTCKLVIATLDQFGPGVLPGGTYKPYANFDTATFIEVWSAARIIEEDCLLESGLPGWEPVGSRMNLGVFLWPTASTMSQAFADSYRDAATSPGLMNSSSLSIFESPNDHADVSTS